MSAPIAPGIVTSLSPFKVQIGSDAPGGSRVSASPPPRLGRKAAC